MRTFISLGLVFVLGMIPFACQPSADYSPETIASLPELKGKKILMVWGGWKGHQPDKFTEKIAAWLEQAGAEVLISDSLGIYKDSTLMASLDVIVPYWTMGQLSKEEAKGLMQAVKNGVGIAGCHGGLGDSFRSNTEYQFMVGGQWVAHPGGQLDYQVNITNPNDPITAGIQDFEIHTEQYYMHVDPNAKVLATTTFSGAGNEWIKGAVMPVAWKKYFGEGRVYYLSLGHAPADFELPQARQLLMRGIRWASGSKHEPKENWLEPVYPSAP